MAATKDIIILSIETSTDVCSAALSAGGETTDFETVSEARMQTSRLAPMVDALLRRNGLGMMDCSAVAVSSGPGSYTGLRVGVSMAKGLCFGAGIPLIGIGTLDLLAAQGLAHDPGADFVVPMIDARRMEVYQAIYGRNSDRISEIEPLILDGESYSALRGKGKVLFCGNGCEKFEPVVSGIDAEFFPCNPDARFMSTLALRKFNASEFENVAYMEPFYLKEFTISKNKKKILG